MLFRSATVEQFLVSFTGKNVSMLVLLHMVNRGCCENTLLLCKFSACCSPSAYGNLLIFWNCGGLYLFTKANNVLSHVVTLLF